MAETTPQDIATILINEWDPIRKEHGLHISAVPPWIIRECIDHYTSSNINRNGMRTLFHHYAEKAVTNYRDFVPMVYEKALETETDPDKIAAINEGMNKVNARRVADGIPKYLPKNPR